ncbi:hypothetical protein PP180_16755 [Muricauda sp. SK9]|jgi:hypothetical protein|nr:MULTISPECIES: hypothetical protein [Allomuricauda]MDC6386158.1 hypothetical protein [Muricauda sp. SK9]MDC6387034.1 hypothetical protein [Muricauda sp. SK9]
MIKILFYGEYQVKMGRSKESFGHDLMDAPVGLTDGTFGLMG